MIERFHASDEYNTGTPAVDYEAQEAAAACPITPDPTQVTVPPFQLDEWVTANAGASGDNTAVLCGPGALHPGLRDYEYTATVITGPSARFGAGATGEPLPVAPGELFLYTLHGAATVTLTPTTAASAASGTAASAAAAGGGGGAHTVKLGMGDTLLVPGGGLWSARIDVEAGSSCMHVVNSKVVAAPAGAATAAA